MEGGSVSVGQNLENDPNVQTTIHGFVTVHGVEPDHDGRLLRLFLPEGSKSHFLAHKGVVYILNEARH